MIYSPECVAEFEAKFGPRPHGVEFNKESGDYRSESDINEGAATLANMLLGAFAANWDRVRELEQAIKAHKLRFCGDEDFIEADLALWKLLEKGNE